MSKFLIVCGGVMSGCGKGVAAASISLLLKLRGHTVTYIKFDPYLNTNAGIMAPGQHGECFLCDDGSEVDLDGGHLERLAGISMSSKNFATAGTLYKELIQEQEQGKFLGSTVQVVPHLTSKIHHRLLELGKEADVVVVEIGGTVGDIESAAFFEAVRQFRLKRGVDLSIIMVAPVIAMSISGELKTKPLQNSVKELQRHGLQPEHAPLSFRSTTTSEAVGQGGRPDKRHP